VPPYIVYSSVYILLDDLCAINVLCAMHYEYVIVVFWVLCTLVGVSLQFIFMLHCVTGLC